MLKRFLPILCLILLAGCAGQRHVSNEREPQPSLEPEIAALDALRNSRGRPLTEVERQALGSRQELSFRLTPAETEEMQQFFQYFTRDKHDTVQRWMLRSEPHLEYVRAVLASHRLPADLLALPYIESGYSTMAVSSSGAVGMWQFMPATAQRFGLTVDWWLDERRDPYLSTVAAARYLKTLHKQFNDWQLALAAYNAGEGSISRAMASTGKQNFNSLARSGPLRDETRHYVPKFLAMLKIVRNAKRLGFDAPDMRGSKDLTEVSIPAGTDLSGLAEHLGLSWPQFHALNPAYRRMVSPPDRSTQAWVPKAQHKSALAYLSGSGRGLANGSAVRVARGGETWWSLSKDCGVPANELRLANKNAAAPAPGKTVLVPLAACEQDRFGQIKGMPPAPARQDQNAPRSAPAALAQAGAGQPTLYIVRKGDTLESVAQKAGVGVQDVIDLNKANPRDALVPGTPLLLPKAQAAAAAAAPTQIASEAPATQLDPTPRYKIIRRSGS